MKITINGSAKELTELAIALSCMESEAKRADLPPLLAELAEDEKINELSEAIRNAGKENAPQSETAEQNYEMRYLNTFAKDFEKTAHGISERRAMIESMRS